MPTNWNHITSFSAESSSGASFSVGSITGLKLGDLLVCMWGASRSSGAFYTSIALGGGDTWTAHPTGPVSSTSRGGMAWCKVVDAVDIAAQPITAAVTRSGGGTGVAAEGIQVDQYRVNGGVILGGDLILAAAFSTTAATTQSLGVGSAATYKSNDQLGWSGLFGANITAPTGTNTITAPETTGTVYNLASNGGSVVITQAVGGVTTGLGGMSWVNTWTPTSPFTMFGWSFAYSPVLLPRIPAPPTAVMRASNWLISAQPWKKRTDGLILPGFSDKRLVLA